MPSPHVVLQISGDVMLPPLHVQPVSTWQVLFHPSPLIVFPSSQLVSVSFITIPSPQISSHISLVVGLPPIHLKPSSIVQVLLHPSPLFKLLSSHFSADSFLPSPQTGNQMSTDEILSNTNIK